MLCVALLGEPGIGKSYVIDAYCESVRGGAGEVFDVDFRWDHGMKEKHFAIRTFARMSSPARARRRALARATLRRRAEEQIRC